MDNVFHIVDLFGNCLYALVTLEEDGKYKFSETVVISGGTCALSYWIVNPGPYMGKVAAPENQDEVK